MATEAKHYYFGGVNGVGKTEVIKTIARLNPHFQPIYTTTALMTYMGIPGDYDALRAMDQAIVADYYLAFTREIVASTHSQSLLFDSHYMNLVRGMVYDRCGPGIKLFAGLVLIAAPIVDILARIETDQAKKDRALFPDNSTPADKQRILADYARTTERRFLSLRRELRIPGVMLNNKPGNLERVARQFIAFTENV